MFCSKCGNEIAESTVFCNKCGTKIVKAETPPPPSAETTTVKPKESKSAKDLLEDSMFDSFGKCMTMAILGIFITGSGVFMLCSTIIAVFKDDNVKGIGILIGLLMLLVTAFGVFALIGARNHFRQFIKFKKQKKEAENNDHYIY